MTDYKTIRGKKVKFFETDLSSGEAEGQLFFSDTSKEMKIGVSSSAWHSEAPLITARQALGGIGIQTHSGVYGGNDLGPQGNPWTQKVGDNDEDLTWLIR